MEIYILIIIIVCFIITNILYIKNTNQNTKIVLYILLIIILVLSVIYYKYNNADVVYETSSLNNVKYLVRDLPDKNVSANMLAQISINMEKLTNYLYENKTKYKQHTEHIEQLHSKMKDCIIMENGENDEYTSYSVNKGEQIIFCLRSRNNKDKLHDINLLMYVVLHEMSHVACPEYDHTPLFKEIFAFIATVATELQLYDKIDFSVDNQEYCGMILNESII